MKPINPLLPLGNTDTLFQRFFSSPLSEAWLGVILSRLMLCQQCYQREATVHLTQMMCDVVEKAEIINLCVDCFKASHPTEAPNLTEASQSVCRYCGGASYGGGTDFLALATGVRKMIFMCIPCSLEHARYIRLELQGMSPNLSQEEELTALGALSIETDKHMMQWVSGRDSQ